MSEMTGEFVWLTVGMSRLSHSVSNSVRFLKQCANSWSRGEKKKSLLAFVRNRVTFLNGALPSPQRNGSRSCSRRRRQGPAWTWSTDACYKKGLQRPKKKKSAPLFKAKRRRKGVRGCEQGGEGEKSLAVGVCMHQHHNDGSSWNRNSPGQ